MKLLTFDLGTHMGLAWLDPKKPRMLQTREWILPGKRPERLAALLKLLLEFRAYRPDTIVYERPFARGQAATRSGWGIAGVIEAWAETRGCSVTDVTPSEIKVFATGNGKAEKPDMIAAAQTFGYTGTNEHEADAVCLLMYAHHHITTEK